MDAIAIKKSLMRGDKDRVSQETGYTRRSLGEILSGRRKMPDKVKKSILSILEEREELDRALDMMTNPMC